MGWGIASDDQGHVYVTGHFQQGVAFGKYPLAATGGSSDLFLVKLKPPSGGAP